MNFDLEFVDSGQAFELDYSENDDAYDMKYDDLLTLKGDPGVSVTHEWNGTVLTVTSASGTSSADLRGPQGVPGEPGHRGEPGYTPVKGVDYFDGKDGYTPVKGKDYFIETDKAEMVAAVRAQLITEQWTFTLTDGSVVTKDVVME